MPDQPPDTTKDSYKDIQIQSLLDQNKYLTEKQLEEDFKSVETQILELSPDTKGIVLIRYGTPDYMVSGRAAKKIFEKIAVQLTEKFQGTSFVLLPFYFEIEFLNLEELYGNTK